uniref:C-type lectin domain-containing protein n=1 Tax=Mus spicilegus TaxID=10103 RepID=A0A8C6MQL6_MUSSI
MTEQEVTFSAVRFHKSSGLQNRVRLEETLKPRKAGLKVCSVPWQFIVITLGILISLRLVIVAVHVTNSRGDKYFVMDRKPWSRCNQTCQSSSLSLLKIDDEDELKFLQLVVPSDSCWIGLPYDNKKKDWAWIDNRPSKLALNTMKYNIRDGGCMFLSKTRLDNNYCDQSLICICGRRLDKFPH